MRIFTIIIFLLLPAIYSHAQQDIHIDSAIQAIRQIKNDTVRMDSLYHTARRLRREHPKEALMIGKMLLQDVTEYGDMPRTVLADRLIAVCYNKMHDFDQSIKFYLEELRIQKELKQYDEQIKTMHDMCIIYDITKDIENEKKYVVEALQICDQHKADKKVWKQRIYLLDNLATIYKKENRLDTAIKVYEDVIAQAKKINDTDQLVGSLTNMAIAFKNNKNYTRSLAAYNEAILLIDTVNDADVFSVILDNMAVLFYQSGDLVRSEQYALRALAIAKRTNNIELLRDLYETLKNVYTKEKRYAEALDYSSKWSDIKDTLFNEEKSAKIKELQARYDWESKDKQIAAQDAKITSNRKINLFLALTAVLLAVIGMLVSLNRRRKKHLDEQKTIQMQRQLEVKERDNEIYRLRNVELKHSNDEIVLRNKMIEEEKKRSEALLLNILPEETAKELLIKGHALSIKYDLVTVMFVDFVGFTIIAGELKAEDLVERIHHYFKTFDSIVLKHGLEKIKTIGDSYMCAGGLPVANTTNPVDVVNAALDIVNFVKSDESRHYFDVRIGIHSGPVVAGVVGMHKFQYDIWGDAVNVASRVEENSLPGRINISGATYELVKDHFACEYRGKILAKNKGEMDMYFVNGKKS